LTAWLSSVRDFLRAAIDDLQFNIEGGSPMPLESAARQGRLGSATMLPCRSCGFSIPFVIKLGRYALGCPECAARTPIEVCVERSAIRIKSLPR
jgi:hypothetical protein